MMVYSYGPQLGLNPLNIGVAVQTLIRDLSFNLPRLNPLNIGVAVQTSDLAFKHGQAES